jgi:hypothetical protein
VQPLGHVLLVVYISQDGGVPAHAAVSYHVQCDAVQAALEVLAEHAVGLPEHDPVGLPQPHPCSVRQVERVALAKQGLAVVKQTTSHEHPAWARQDDWL